MLKEEPFSLPAGDGFTIYGCINRALQPSGKAVVLCHGLGCNMQEHHFQTAKRFFPDRGYDVIRFSFYSAEEDARRLVDCDVAVHTADLTVVLDHFAPLYKNLYVVGHSYGGLAVLVANPEKAAAVSLWDATFVPVENDPWGKYWEFSKELDTCLATYPPITTILGKKVYEEKKTFTQKKLDSFARALTVPAQVLAAEALTLNLPNQERLFAALTCEKEYWVIAGAGHMFYEGNTVFDLLENTYRWFERF